MKDNKELRAVWLEVLGCSVLGFWKGEEGVYNTNQEEVLLTPLPWEQANYCSMIFQKCPNYPFYNYCQFWVFGRVRVKALTLATSCCQTRP